MGSVFLSLTQPANMRVSFLGEGHLHPRRAVLNRERPAHSNAEGQEERNATTLPIPDRRAVRWDQTVEGEEENKMEERTQEL